MFDKRFAYQAQGGDWEGWTPPWMRRDERFGGRRGRGPWGHHHGPHLFRMWRGRGPFGPPWGGPEGPGSRFFGRGDVKYALLELLQERPMHGYEMMKALEDRSGGFYSPSAGTIYPTLQLLEDRGHVSVTESEGKKVYSITDAGRAALAERKKEEDQFAPPWARRRGPEERRNIHEMQALRSEAMEVARLFAIAGRMAFRDQEQIGRLRSVIERTRKELSDMIYTSEPKSETQTPRDSGPSVQDV